MDNQSRLSSGMQVGDYLLKEMIAEGPAIRTWSAEQVSVKREVVIDSLRSAILKDVAIREAFLDDVRAKAKVDHSLIGSVFEVVCFENFYFYTRERLSGDTIESLLAKKNKLMPANVVHILKQVAEANLFFEQNDIATMPIGSHQIFIGDNHLTRLVNMAITGERDQSVSSEDKKVLGEAFHQLLDREKPGATRVSSLCDFMVDEYREIPITWEQIRDLSVQVEKQLREQPSVELNGNGNSGKAVLRNTMIGLVAAVLMLAIFFLVVNGFPKPPSTKARELNDMIFIETESIELRGESIKVPSFSIDAHEVTIAEYAEFIEAVESDGMKRYAAEKMPQAIKSFYPGGKAQWEEMYAAAEEGIRWNKLGRVMGVNQPVIFVEWWAAKAYANWKTSYEGDGAYDLPSEEQWLAALVGETPEDLKPAEWADVDDNKLDLTESGIYGLAGGVSEWTSSFQLHFDDKTKLPVVLGASCISHEKGAKDREVVRNRQVNRSDLGFRLIKEKI